MQDGANVTVKKEATLQDSLNAHLRLIKVKSEPIDEPDECNGDARTPHTPQKTTKSHNNFAEYSPVIIKTHRQFTVAGIVRERIVTGPCIPLHGYPRQPVASPVRKRAKGSTVNATVDPEEILENVLTED